MSQVYERIVKNAGFPYFVNGVGGRNLDGIVATPEEGEAGR